MLGPASPRSDRRGVARDREWMRSLNVPIGEPISSGKFSPGSCQRAPLCPRPQVMFLGPAGLPSGAGERWEGLRVRFGGNAPHRHLSASCFVPMTPAHSHSTGTFMRLKKESVCQGETDASLLCALRAASPRVPRRREDARASGAVTTGGQWFRELAHHDLLPVPPKPRNLGSGQK